MTRKRIMDELDDAFGPRIAAKIRAVNIESYEKLSLYRPHFAKIRGIGSVMAQLIESVFVHEDRVREAGALALNSLSVAARRRVLRAWEEAFIGNGDMGQ